MKNAGYNIIAKFYDKVIGPHNDIQNYLLKKILRYNKNARSILELGCGTGKNLENLQNEFEITGIDISNEMLKIAKKKIPDGKFYIKDIRNFDLKKKFDIIICMYDTVNHLTLFSEWKRLFNNVNKHLSKGGLFIFDLNTLFKLHYLSQISPLVYEFDKNHLIVDVKNISANVYNWNLKVFDRRSVKSYGLHEVNIKEASFESEKVKSELEKYFMVKNIETEDHKRISSKTERVFFACAKRET